MKVDNLERPKTMIITKEELEGHIKKLRDIQKMTEPQQNKEFLTLQSLAQDVGASTINRYKGYGAAGRAELIENIHKALQTHAMILQTNTMIEQTSTMLNMCKIAAKNYKIALAIAIAAFLSAAGAWFAVLSK